MTDAHQSHAEVRLVSRAVRGHPRGMRDRPLLPTFVLLWSSGYVVGAVAIEVADPLPLLAARFVLASLVAVPLALRHGRWRGAPLGRLAVVGVLLQVVQFGGVYGGFALGVPAALSALVMLGLVAARHDRSGRRDRQGARRRAALDRARRRRRSGSRSASRRSSAARASASASRVTLLGMLGLAAAPSCRSTGPAPPTSASPRPCSRSPAPSLVPPGRGRVRRPFRRLAAARCSRSAGWPGAWGSSRCCCSSTCCAATRRARSARCCSSCRR